MNTALKVGLTGGIGSGKSTISAYFAQKDIVIVDADKIARDVVAIGQPIVNIIQDKFGEESLLSDGSLNRGFIRQQVFRSPELKAWLDGTLHPLIREEMSKQMNNAQSPYCIVDVPLLTENGMAKLFDRILVVDCPESLQLERAVNRDNSDVEGIQRIIAMQASRAERKAIADDIISNDTSIKHLYEQLETLHQTYLSLAKAC